MQQLTQKLRNGKMDVLEVPIPQQKAGHIIVKNYYSLISAGTEGSTVKAARKGYIGKAKERPQQVKQVVDTLKSKGPVQTYRAVMKKLDAFSPLGYSCVGEVIDLSPEIKGFSIGDYVACGGLTACHSEVVSVPANLCVKLNHDTDLKQAAYNTLGAISLQAVRQVALNLGETCAIIGLGLLGQVAALLLRASGIKVIGIDIDQEMVNIAKEHAVDLALNRDDARIENEILSFSSGLGCDGVIIAAAADSLDPINFAGKISRKRGTIVVLGNVPTGFDREPYFYQKELQIKMSCSYGPGRYDALYEEKGIDYPAPYVRWTENRNMQAFQDLIFREKINLKYLTTHEFDLEEAPAAYEMLLNKSEPYIGILLKYDKDKPIIDKRIHINSNRHVKKRKSISPVIGFIGAGSHAQIHLLPNVTKVSGVVLKGVMTATSTGARSVCDRYQFDFCTNNDKDILENKDINTVFIATRHDSHAEYVQKALNAGKHVFIEKPLCLNEQELNQIIDVYKSQSNLLMVGYNRRFSPLTQAIKYKFGSGTMAMNFRINAGVIPSNSWYQDMDIGGGRIIGEVCHFIDLLTYLNGSPPVSVHAIVMPDPFHLNDTVNISLQFKNGSVGNISYFSNGNNLLPKERVEIFSNNMTAVIDDFKTLTMYLNQQKKQKKLVLQDKGHEAGVIQFINAVKNGKQDVIPFSDVVTTSLVTFKIHESIQTNTCIKI